MSRTRQLHPVPLTERLRRRLAARRTGQQGLALLDVLLGMAIFALIAVIAVQAMGMFRDRAYMTQATSDAKQVGTGIMAAMTEPGATPESIPTGLLSTEDLEKLGINLTGGNRAYVAPAMFSADAGSGTELIALVSAGSAPATAVISTSSNINGFDVCVENESAYATWRAAGGSIAETGYIPGDGDCSTVLGTIGPIGGGEDEDPATPVSYPACTFASEPLMPIYFYGEAIRGDFPDLDPEVGMDDYFYPSQTGISEANWSTEAPEWVLVGNTPWFDQGDVSAFTFDSESGFFFVDATLDTIIMDLSGGGCTGYFDLDWDGYYNGDYDETPGGGGGTPGDDGPIVE